MPVTTWRKVPGIRSAAVPDGALLRRVAAAERYRAAYDRADAECARRFEAMRRHPDYPKTDLDTPEARALWEALAGRLGIPDFDDGCLHLYERYGAATRAVFEVPARTLDGARDKLRLGIAMLKAEHRGTVDPVD